MKATLWSISAVISAAVHLGAAYWVQAREVAPGEPLPPPMELTAVRLPPPPEPEPEPEPEIVPEPELSEPEPPRQRRPVVRRARQPQARVEPPPAPPKIGLPEEATSAGGDLVTPLGVSLDGELGSGLASIDAPPAPPAPEPAPAGQGAAKRPGFVPIYRVTRLPKPRRLVQPEVPEEFRDARREAVVVVEVEIDARGRVVGARVVRGAGFGLDQAALAAARRTEFEPARMNGQPVAVRYQLPYRFRVRG